VARRRRQPTPGRTAAGSDRASSVSPLTLNRISFYLRCLRQLQAEQVHRISSKELAGRFHLSAAQIRKDLAHFGEFGIRGVGYDVEHLVRHLSQHLGLERLHRMIIVGMGNLGMALARYLGFNSGAFQVVAGVDRDRGKVGLRIGEFTIRHTDQMADAIHESGAEIGVLSVPAGAARENYDLLIEAGILGVLNFTPARLRPVEGIALKDVDLRIHLEELAFYLPAEHRARDV
jgi:redox-sensing transcriptional repressor